jgi:hypothetical protein
MATTYTSTVQVHCWKLHKCVGCGGRYGYEFLRSIKGSSSTAEGARADAQRNVQKALVTDTDLHPCPTCGLHQPDMIGQRRAYWHWITVGCALAAAVVLLILVAQDIVQLYDATYAAATLCAAAAAAFFAIERWNPNRDIAANRQRAAALVTRGTLQHEPGQSVPDGDLEQHARPRASSLQIVSRVLLAVAVVAALAPDVTRAGMGWPANADAYPPVVGPGDHARIYMNGSISSIKGYWRGQPKVVLRDGDLLLPVNASTNDNSWGGTIYAKSSEKSSNSTPWVVLTLPVDTALTGKTVGCEIDLGVEYPEAAGSSFQTTTRKMRRSVRLELASAGAGDTYRTLWWASTLTGVGLTLLAGLLLVGVARAFQRRARPTQVFSPND